MVTPLHLCSHSLVCCLFCCQLAPTLYLNITYQQVNWLLNHFEHFLSMEWCSTLSQISPGNILLDLLQEDIIRKGRLPSLVLPSTALMCKFVFIEYDDSQLLCQAFTLSRCFKFICNSCGFPRCLLRIVLSIIV